MKNLFTLVVAAAMLAAAMFASMATAPASVESAVEICWDSPGNRGCATVSGDCESNDMSKGWTSDSGGDIYCGDTMPIMWPSDGVSPRDHHH